MNKFEEWFVSQYFYTNMRFVHGDALFDKDGDFFRILAVQIAWEAWQSRQAEVDEKDKRIEELESRLKAVHVLARMRSAVITAERWLTLRPHIKNAIKCLDRKEKALQGFQGDRS